MKHYLREENKEECYVSKRAEDSDEDVQGKQQTRTIRFNAELKI